MCVFECWKRLIALVHIQNLICAHCAHIQPISTFTCAHKNRIDAQKSPKWVLHILYTHISMQRKLKATSIFVFASLSLPLFVQKLKQYRKNKFALECHLLLMSAIIPYVLHKERKCVQNGPPKKKNEKLNWMHNFKRLFWTKKNAKRWYEELKIIATMWHIRKKLISKLQRLSYT